MVSGVGRCTAGTLYISGEKIPLDLYTVLLIREDVITEIGHWRELPEKPERALVIPRGLEHEYALFLGAGWSGECDVKSGAGKKGARAPRTWSDEDTMSVYAMRAQSAHIKVPGAEALREHAVLALLDRSAPARLCEALWVSPDGRLASLAAEQHRPTAQMIASMSKSSSEHLRVRAARLSRDKRVLAKLLDDDSERVRRAAVCNPRSEWRDIIKTGGDGAVEPDLLTREQATLTMLSDAVSEGGIGARVAIAHPKMVDVAERMMKRGNRLATFAAANPGLRPSIALELAGEDQEVNSVLAGNSGVVGRMTTKEAESFIERLAGWGMAEEIGMVARSAKLSAAAQKRLLNSDLSEIVAWGLSGSEHISEASQMTILAHCSAVGAYNSREQILSSLCANKTCSTDVLAAADTKTPSVALAVRSNQNTSGTIRDEARRNLEALIDKRENDLREIMRETRYTKAPREHIIHINEYHIDPKPIASLVLNESVIESSAVFQKDAGVWAMGGDSIEMSGVFYGNVEHTVITLRIDPKRAQSSLETNWAVDSVGVCLNTGDGEVFQLIEPTGEMRGREVMATMDVSDAQEDTRRERMVRMAKRVTTGMDARTVITHGARLVPGGSTAVKRVKNLVEFEKMLLGKPRGYDRTTVLPLPVMPGDTLSVLLPDCKRSECVKQTLDYTRELLTCGRITEDQQDAVERWVGNLEQRASKSLAKHTLPTRYLDMLRYQAGRRRMIDMIVNGETPWHEEEREQ